MKKVAVIILSTIILMVSAKDLVVFIFFKINQDVIAQKYCVNRNAPEKKCHGKCKLMETIKNNNEKEEKLVILTPSTEERTLYITPITKEDHHLINKEVINTGHSNFYDHIFVHKVFHPPKPSNS